MPAVGDKYFDFFPGLHDRVESYLESKGCKKKKLERMAAPSD
jgi:hypothetical protein